MTATHEKDTIHPDGGALAGSGLFIQTRFSLKCRPRHKRHPTLSWDGAEIVALQIDKT